MLKRSRKPEKRAEYEAELAVPHIPRELLYIWHAYRRLRRRKGGNGFGAMPIEWPDIDAFNRNSKLDMVPWEIEIIEDLDDLFLQAPNSKDDKTNDQTDE